MLASSTACRRFTSTGPTASRAFASAFWAALFAAAKNFLRSGSTSSSRPETFFFSSSMVLSCSFLSSSLTSLASFAAFSVSICAFASAMSASLAEIAA